MVLKKGLSKSSKKNGRQLDSSIEFIKPRIRDIIESVGEDVGREGLLDTPKRFAKSMHFLTSGYDTRVEEVVGSALFKAESSELVLVRDIELYSLCEHHMLPFFGKAQSL